TIPLKLSVGLKTVKFSAKLDTGASFCIFQRVYGETLGIDVEKGYLEQIVLANGNVIDVYGHDVTLSAFDLQLDVTVYFASDPTFRRNVLGRQGWLQQLQLGLIDYDGKLYVSKYDK
ncbi:MAG: aspartyl protease family protein, partial [Pyrinomonadaceae bacterium]